MKDQMYVLVAFPYPSGKGLHIGHFYNYAVMDSYCKWQRYKGTNVFQPFGYDAFGLPAENYAKQIGGDPREVTEQNIENFRRQMAHMHTDFDEKLITCEPSYYKWTQWIFIKLVEHGLAYKKIANVNYCNSCETVLANEQVKDGKCDRCGNVVMEKELDQWFVKITDYKQRLLDGIDALDYPESTKKQQRVWIENLRDWCVSRQRKWGCPIPIEGEEDTLDTFVDSSFYFIRYCDPTNENEIAAKEKIIQPDIYVIGAEHSCMHLIYSRFINMFLYDIGVTPFEEPFKKVIHQGMIKFGGEKMAKSKGNTISPDDYDPSELRMYCAFIGHYFDGGDWDDSKIKGIKRFISRFKTWMDTEDGADQIDIESLKKIIDGYVESFKFNKVVSSWMEFYNKNKNKRISRQDKDTLIAMLRCFAPTY